MEQARSARSRRTLLEIAKVLIPIVVALLVTYLRFVVVESGPFLEAALVLVLVVASILTTWMIWPWLDRVSWKVVGRLRFTNPRVGILFERDCSPTLTKFGPDAWQVSLSRHWKRVSLISPEQISTEFAVIINPYGESYPEEYVLRTRTLNRIERFVLNGGMFVSAGGYPFFYAFDRRNSTLVPLAGELALLRGRVESSGILMVPKTSIGVVTGTRILLEPANAPGMYDLASETVLLTRLHLRVTLGSEEVVGIYQDPKEISLVGDIITATGLGSVIQFRAVRSPIPNCYPLLRARSGRYGEIYPIVALPYGKGFFLFAGVMLDHPDAKFAPTIDKTLDLVQRAMLGFCRGIAQGSVPLSIEL